MAGEFPPLPEGFIGAVDLRLPGEEGHDTPAKRLGIEVACHGPARQEDEGKLVVSVLIELFTSPPLLSTADVGVLEIDLVSRQVEIRDDGGHVRVVGEIAADHQSIRGHVALKEIQVMDLSGDYSNCPLELAGFQEP